MKTNEMSLGASSVPGVWSTQGAEGTSSSVPGTVPCLPCALQPGGHLPCCQHSWPMQGPMQCAWWPRVLCLWCTQSRVPFPVTISNFPLTLQTQSVHHTFTAHQGAGAVSGSQPLCSAAWGGQAESSHHICHQGSCGIKAEVLITQMLENGERWFPW